MFVMVNEKCMHDAAVAADYGHGAGGKLRVAFFCTLLLEFLEEKMGKTLCGIKIVQQGGRGLLPPAIQRLARHAILRYLPSMP